MICLWPFVNSGSTLYYPLCYISLVSQWREREIPDLRHWLNTCIYKWLDQDPFYRRYRCQSIEGWLVREHIWLVPDILIDGILMYLQVSNDISDFGQYSSNRLKSYMALRAYIMVELDHISGFALNELTDDVLWSVWPIL